VLDFLIEALNAWYEKKSTDAASVPSHNVTIEVISGASAGGVCAALLGPAMLGGLQLQNTMSCDGLTVDGAPMKIRCVLPRLYDAWVKGPRMVPTNGKSGAFLSTEDILGGEPVQSALNSEALLNIARTGIFWPAGTTGTKYPFLSKRLHLFLTLTNLRGVPYTVTFKEPETADEDEKRQLKGHGMLSHAEIAHFVVTGIGTGATGSAWAESDTNGRARPIAELIGLGDLADEWLRFVNSALGTAAFPIGLAARELRQPNGDWKTRLWPLDTGDKSIEPDWPENKDKKTDYAYAYVNADGGAIDNEPFEYARWGIKLVGKDLNPRHGEDADRAVLMIDPFPEAPEFKPDEPLVRSLTTVVKRLIPSLMDQARFKPEELVNALREDLFSRFLISPRRSVDGVLQPFGIACGLLGGFGGFLYEPFRAHDYQLGRRNCQMFLKQTFALPENNKPIFDGQSPPALARFKTPDGKMFTGSNGDAHRYQQIIPLLGDLAAKDELLPDWPRMPQKEFKTLVDWIGTRLDAVIPPLIQDQFASRMLRTAVRLVWWAFGKDRILAYAKDTVLQDLIRRDQWEPFAKKSRDARAVLTALADPAYDARQMDGLAQSTGLAADAIKEILKDEKKADTVWSGGIQGVNGTCYTLDERKPSLWSRLPGVGNLKGWLAEPVVG
jgi:hypothetical protein